MNYNYQSVQLTGEGNIVAKLVRARGGCLGVKRRGKTW